MTWDSSSELSVNRVERLRGRGLRTKQLEPVKSETGDKSRAAGRARPESR